MGTHPELEAVPNLQFIKALTSLKSRGYVKEQFAWRHFYWSLTNEGIQYLRDYLHLPPEIVPATLKRQPQRETRPRTSALPEPEVSSPRPTERLTERLMTKPELLDQDQPPWNSKEDSVVESPSSNFLVFCYFMSS